MMFKKLIAEQDSVNINVDKFTQNYEIVVYSKFRKTIWEFANAQNSLPQGGLPGNIDSNSRKVNMYP